jgi:hypothetical protein
MDQPVYTYTAYGLGIHAPFPIPELTPGEGPCDVRILRGSIERVPDEEARDYGYLHATAREAYFIIEGVGGGRVREGKEILWEPAPGVPFETTRRMLLGVSMGVLLQQRQYLVLHASAVEVHGRVAAFIGWKGWGKSTLAATLHGRGHPFVADDVVAVEPHGDGFQVLAGMPNLKLWPDAVQASLNQNPEELPALYDGGVKRLRTVEGGVVQEPRPLGCLYVLALGDTLTIERIPAKEAFLELIRHSFAATLLMPMGVAAAHAHVPVFRLTRPASLDLLPATALRVEQHLRGDGEPQLQEAGEPPYPVPSTSSIG